MRWLNFSAASFVRRFAIFLTSVLLIALLLFFSARFLSRKGLNVENSISIIACGDSHMQAAINDSVLSSSTNISLTSQPFIYSYSILVQLLARNPPIQRVLLGYSFHSLSPMYDVLLFDSERAQKACLICENYLTVTDLSYVFQLVRTDGIQILGLSSMKQIWQSMHQVDIHDIVFIGEYYPSDRQSLTDENVEAAIQRHFYDDSGLVSNGVALYQVNYLYKIAELCNQNDIELFLVNTPISTQYYEAIPRSYIDNYYYIASTVDATLLDYHDFTLPDSCYGDADHLNYHGATEFSLYLDSMLNE